jgi:glycosyltransferase involved in cell wall biosynthesis
MRELEIPYGVGWELLVVDNGSSDGTARLIEAWRSRLPLKPVHQPRPGLSNARNAAVAAASGRYILWTDDDVRIPSRWIECYRQGFRDHPDAAVFGGPIVAQAEAPVCAWFADRMRRWPISSVVAARDLGPSERRLEPRAAAVPWGANYAIRTSEQRRLLYDSALDFGEETDLVGRLLAGGSSGWWLPQCGVTHVIPSERQSRAYIAAYFRRAGRAAAYLERRSPTGDRRLLGADAWTSRPTSLVVVASLASAALGRAAWAAKRRDLALRALARKHYLAGILDFRART